MLKPVYIIANRRLAISRTKAVLDGKIRITDHIGLGALTRFVPAQEITAVLKQTQTQSQRERLLPARVMVYYVMALYCERWEIETSLDELKTHLHGGNFVLRSKTPELVRQEFYGLMLTHTAIRTVMLETAVSADIDPDRLSFLHAVRVIRRKLPRFTAASPLRYSDNCIRKSYRTLLKKSFRSGMADTIRAVLNVRCQDSRSELGQ